MSDRNQFGKDFWKHYQFWILVCSALSIVAVAFFSWQSYKLQFALNSIEETRQKETFSNDLEIVFSTNALRGCSPERARYDLRLVNKSSQTFNDLETSVNLCYEDPRTKDSKKSEIFTFPQKDLYPSDVPVCFLENPEFTETLCFNISEAKKAISSNYKPALFEFSFKWGVEIADKRYLFIQKRKTFSIRR